MEHLIVLQEEEAASDEYVPGDIYKYLDDDIFNIVNVFFGFIGGCIIGGSIMAAWH